MNIVAILRAVLPGPAVAFLDRLAGKLEQLLQGEPLRVIVYGAAVVIWGDTHVLQLLNIGNLAVISFDGAILTATVAAGAITEFARKFVYSPATVATMQNEHEQDLETVAQAAVKAGFVASTPGPIPPTITELEPTINPDPCICPDDCTCPCCAQCQANQPGSGEGPVDESAKGEPLPAAGDEVEPDDNLEVDDASNG